MTAPRISVIVPVFGATFLSQALASIAPAVREAFQLIVVDDGSPEEIEPVVRRDWPDARIIRQDNKGPSAARNRGLAEATGDLVTFFDADDCLVPGGLAALFRVFRDAPAAGIAQGLVRAFDNAGGTVRNPYYPGYNSGSLVIRRELLAQIGGFDERLHHSEDVDLLMRLQDRGALRVLMPQLILEYRRHPSSLTAGVTGRTAASHWIGLLHDRRMARPSSPEKDSAAWDEEITVVLVVRNGRRFLPDALASIRAQTVSPLEILAVVGESSDGTLDYLNEQPDVRVVVQEGEGLAAARNLACAEARGRSIAFHDHDDLWHPAKLGNQLRAIAPFVVPAACITRFLPDGAATAQLAEPGWSPSALLFQRAVFDRVGPFDSNLGLGCDSDWLRRLRLMQIPCAMTSQVLLTKRRHGANLSADPARNRDAMFRMLRKHRVEQAPQ